MTNFGLAQIKRQGWCYDYDTGVDFDPLTKQLNERLKAQKYGWGMRWFKGIFNAIYKKAWINALSARASLDQP